MITVDPGSNVTTVAGPDRLRRLGEWGRLLEEDDKLANLARLAAVITAEALDPDHPSHEYFIARQRDIQATAIEIVRAALLKVGSETISIPRFWL